MSEDITISRWLVAKTGHLHEEDRFPFSSDRIYLGLLDFSRPLSHITKRSEIFASGASVDELEATLIR